MVGAALLEAEDEPELFALACVEDGGATFELVFEEGTRVTVGVVGVGDGVPEAAAVEDPPPPEVRACTVTTSRTRTRTAEPISRRRRRQYTEGGCDPTG